MLALEKFLWTCVSVVYQMKSYVVRDIRFAFTNYPKAPYQIGKATLNARFENLTDLVKTC